MYWADYEVDQATMHNIDQTANQVFGHQWFLVSKYLFKKLCSNRDVEVDS